MAETLDLCVCVCVCVGGCVCVCVRIDIDTDLLGNSVEVLDSSDRRTVSNANAIMMYR